jgi:hypothetical protein
MHPLMLHRTCDLGPIRSVTASVRADATGCTAEFRLEGGIDRIILPEPAASVRADNLWQTTCFEIFWQPIGGTYYREFNLSPSGRWAAYDFDAYREGMRDAPVEAFALSCTHSAANGTGELVLTAAIATDLAVPAQVALNAIIEHTDGALQYWALAFGPGKPDFHSEACRQLIVERD